MTVKENEEECEQYIVSLIIREMVRGFIPKLDVDPVLPLFC